MKWNKIKAKLVLMLAEHRVPLNIASFLRLFKGMYSRTHVYNQLDMLAARGFVRKEKSPVGGKVLYSLIKAEKEVCLEEARIFLRGDLLGDDVVRALDDEGGV